MEADYSVNALVDNCLRQAQTCDALLRPRFLAVIHQNLLYLTEEQRAKYQQLAMSTQSPGMAPLLRPTP